ncbi:MAG: outer membrane beta-barrel domain-containing protein [Polyangiaceae bacterium]|nr:outer membrane beta-barrel domain-containing protein [Polyangiaceae bacterium]
MLVRLPPLLLALGLGVLALLGPRPAAAQCVDEALKEQLVGRRAYRGVVPRLFKKALRHEISPMGGWYAGDISDGAPVYGGAYTFHFSEYLGLEASYFRTKQRYGLLEAIIDRQQGLIAFVDSPEEDMQLFLGHLIWSLAYGKVRWLGGGIGRYDFYLSLGAGATDTSSTGGLGITGSGGFGMKFYLLDWLAFRLDARDHVRNHRAPLGVDKVVNDITLMGGLSVFIPFKS